MLPSNFVYDTSCLWAGWGTGWYVETGQHIKLCHCTVREWGGLLSKLHQVFFNVEEMYFRYHIPRDIFQQMKWFGYPVGLIYY